MSYEYTDSVGDKLRINSNGYDGATLIAEGAGGRTKAITVIDHDDVPTVAAELLKAAGQEATILPKADMPSYVVRGNYLHFQRPDGKEHTIGLYESAEDLARVAHYNLVAAEYIESKATREADAEKKLQERRDALATELSNGYGDYESAADGMQKAIDRIIELEDGK